MLQFDILWDQSNDMQPGMESRGIYSNIQNQINQGNYQSSMNGDSHAAAFNSMMMFGSPHMFQQNYSSMNSRQYQVNVYRYLH